MASITTLPDLPPDILQAKILPRLDGSTLPAVGCASSYLHVLCKEAALWVELCRSTWPSIGDLRIGHVISTFPAGHRSFFIDSFPTLPHNHREHPAPEHNHCSPPTATSTTQLISAVDLQYKGKPILSEVQLMETASKEFLRNPFWMEIAKPNGTIQLGFPRVNVLEDREEKLLSHLEESLTLSWILIDPIRKRAANFSSLRPILVRKHWITNEIMLRYSTIIPGGESPEELVRCKIEATCDGKEGRDLYVKELIMQMQDFDGRSLAGWECLKILNRAMEGGRRKRVSPEEMKSMHEEYLEMRVLRRERIQREEKRFEMMLFWIRISTSMLMLFSTVYWILFC